MTTPARLCVSMYIKEITSVGPARPLLLPIVGLMDYPDMLRVSNSVPMKTVESPSRHGLVLDDSPVPMDHPGHDINLLLSLTSLV